MRNIRKTKPLLRRSVKQKHPAVLKKLAIGFIIAVFAACVYMAIASKTDEARQRTELQKTIQELQTTKAQYEKHQSSSQEEKARQEQIINDLNKKLDETNKALQAKRSSTTTYAAQPVKPTGGSCESWMSAAGIPLSSAALQLIKNESGCRPDAVNPSSGACGIPQALPCSKMPCTLSDPVCQLKWMNSYVAERYGSWEGALSFWHCIGSCSNNYGTIVKTNTWY